MYQLEKLNRFNKAHDLYYETALAEIKNGRKEIHWMWFIFPQIKGLSHSYAELESRQHVIAVTLNELQSARGFRRKRRAQDYVIAVHNYFSLLKKNALLRQMSDFLHVFRKEIQHIYNDFFNI